MVPENVPPGSRISVRWPSSMSASMRSVRMIWTRTLSSWPRVSRRVDGPASMPGSTSRLPTLPSIGRPHHGAGEIFLFLLGHGTGLVDAGSGQFDLGVGDLGAGQAGVQIRFAGQRFGGQRLQPLVIGAGLAGLGFGALELRLGDAQVGVRLAEALLELGRAQFHQRLASHDAVAVGDQHLGHHRGDLRVDLHLPARLDHAADPLDQRQGAVTGLHGLDGRDQLAGAGLLAGTGVAAGDQNEAGGQQGADERRQRDDGRGGVGRRGESVHVKPLSFFFLRRSGGRVDPSLPGIDPGLLPAGFWNHETPRKDIYRNSIHGAFMVLRLYRRHYTCVTCQ